MKKKGKYEKDGGQKKSFLLPVILVVLALALIGCLLWVFLQGDAQQDPAGEPDETKLNAQTEAQDNTQTEAGTETTAAEPTDTDSTVWETEGQTEPVDLNEQIDQEVCQLINGETDMVYGKICADEDTLVLMGAADFEIETEKGTDIVTYLYFDEASQAAAAQLADQQVGVRINRILRRGETFMLSAQFLEADEILIPMDGLVARFPAQWGPYLQITDSAENAAAGYQFCCVYDGETYRLFDILFGAAEGQGVGTAEVDGIQMDVTAVFYDEFADTADKTGSAVYYGMLDAFQGVFESLKECEGFSAQ